MLNKKTKRITSLCLIFILLITLVAMPGASALGTDTASKTSSQGYTVTAKITVTSSQVVLTCSISGPPSNIEPTITVSFKDPTGKASYMEHKGTITYGTSCRMVVNAGTGYTFTVSTGNIKAHGVTVPVGA